ncbi:MAG: Inner membrane transport protein YdhC [Candidatus Celerinatantimonas neptuna]|nr:MAG: Inner membrane transport protein YdhC [Candidatus Celerinatantimonas neptuna]
MNEKPTFCFTLLIILLSIGGLISTDIFLPMLPAMSQNLSVSSSDIQSAIGIFLFGLSISQLIYGPVSDSLGRKNVLLSGLFIWLFATIIISVTHHFQLLLIMRFIQGVGACSGITVSRAIINDCMDKKTAGGFYLTIFPFVGLSPAIAPVIGGFFGLHFGWRSCFVLLTAIIILTILLCQFTLKETLSETKRSHLHVQSFIGHINPIRHNRQFWHYALIPCFAYAAYFSYLVESPFILEKLGLNKSWLSYSYITLSMTYLIGNLTAKRLIRRLSSDQALTMGYIIFLTAGIAFAGQIAFSPYPILTTVIMISILTFANGFLLPLGTAGAIASAPEQAGSASGIMGFIQLASAGLASSIIGKLSHHNPLISAAIIALITCSGALYYWSGQRHFKLAISSQP